MKFWKQKSILSGFILSLSLSLSACNPAGQTTIGQNFYPGVEVSYANSVVTVASPSVISDSSETITLSLEDTNFNPFVTTLDTVTFQASGGTSTGTFGAVTNNGDGTYSAIFSGVTAGTATTIHAFVNGNEIQSTAPTITVLSGNYSLANSVLSVSSNSVASGSSITATLTVKDASGNQNSSGGLTVVFSNSGGTSTGTFSATTDHHDGTYSATFTGDVGGTATTIGATIQGHAVTSALPTVTVSGGNPASITASSGTPQSATAGNAVGSNLVAVVKDSNANVLSGVTVSWAVSTGAGTLTACTTTTDSSGLAHCGFTTSTTTGVSTVTASVANVVNPATFTITATPGAAASMAFSVQPVGGNTVDQTFTGEPTVTVYDANGNVKTDYTSSITLTANSNAAACGSVSDISGGISGNTINAVAGVATFTGVDVFKTNAVRLRASDGTLQVCSNPFVISAGAASAVAATSGGGQTANDGAALANPLIATLTDDHGNVISGTTIDWAVTAGNGILSACTTSTNASGQVQCTYTMGLGSPGNNTITATVHGTAIKGTFSETGSSVSLTQTFNFNSTTAAQYTYDATKIDFTSSYAELTPASQTDNSNIALGFAGGTETGTTYFAATSPSPAVLMLDQTNATNHSELDSSWAPEWASIAGVWHFNGNTNDSSGNGNNGIVLYGSGGSFVTGKLNQGLNFTDNPYSSGLILPGSSESSCSATTFSFWFNSTASPSGFDVLFSKTSAPESILLVPDGGTSLYLQVGTDAPGSPFNINWNAGDNFFDGNWHHVAFTLNNGVVVLYKDGIVDNTGTYTAGDGFCNSAGADLYAAIENSFDELAIWNTALSTAEIQRIYNRQSAKYAGTFTSRVMDGLSAAANWTNFSWTPTLPFFKELPDSTNPASPVSETSANYSEQTSNLMNGIVGLWHLDEPSGATTAIDASGNGNTGTASGTTSFGANGILGSALSLSGSGYVDVGNASNLNITDALTMSVWIKSNYFPSIFRAIMNKGDSAYRLQTYTNNTINFATNGLTNSSLASVTAVADGKWHHIVAIYGGAADQHTYLYIDGQLESSASASGSINTNNIDLAIGQNLDPSVGGREFTGLIDEAAIWSRALSQTEVLELYRRGANRIKYQVKSCYDPACLYKDSNNTPAVWLGPDNTNQTYFSELNNTSVPSDGGDLTTNDSVLAGLPNMTFANFSGLTIPTNRYFQYRAILESDDTGTNCNYGSGATWCSPELKTASVGPNHYDTSAPSITNNTGVSYATLVSLADTLGGSGCNNGVAADSTLYNLSPDGSTWYYWTGAAWSSATTGTYLTASAASAVTANLGTFPAAGTVYFKVFLQSSGTSACALQNLAIGITQ